MTILLNYQSMTNKTINPIEPTIKMYIVLLIALPTLLPKLLFVFFVSIIAMVRKVFRSSPRFSTWIFIFFLEGSCHVRRKGKYAFDPSLVPERD